MNFLEERIVKDGIVKEGNVLKVDSFLNHQMDINLFEEMGAEFKHRFADANITKLLNHLVLVLHVLLQDILMCLLFLQKNQRALILTVICM